MGTGTEPQAAGTLAATATTIIVAVTFLQFLAAQLAQPLVPILVHVLGGSVVAVGAQAAVYAFPPLLLAVAVGVGVDRHGPRPWAVGGSIAVTGGSLLLAASHSVAAVLAAQALLGLASVMVLVALQAHVGAVGGSRRAQLFGLYTFAAALGQLVGPVVGGFLADHVGYPTAFLTGGAASLLAALVALGLPAQRAGAGEATISWRQAAALLRDPVMVEAMTASFVVLLASGVRGAFFPVWALQLGLSVTAIGVLQSVRAASSTAVRPFLGRLVQRFGRRPLLVLMMTTGGLCLAAIPLVRGFWPLLALSAGWGLAIGLTQPLTMVAVADATADDRRGLAMGLRLSSNRLAQVTSPLLFGLVGSAWGMPVALAAGGAVLVVGGLASWGRARRQGHALAG